MTDYSSNNISTATESLRASTPRQQSGADQTPVRRSSESVPLPVPQQNQASVQNRSANHVRERLEKLERIPEPEMQSLVNQANLVLEPRNLELKYRRHEGTDRYYLTLIDSDTKEVAREIPPEWSLDMLARVWEMTGIFMNERG